MRQAYRSFQHKQGMLDQRAGIGRVGIATAGLQFPLNQRCHEALQARLIWKASLGSQVQNAQIVDPSRAAVATLCTEAECSERLRLSTAKAGNSSLASSALIISGPRRIASARSLVPVITTAAHRSQALQP